jgi:hypothetical protein
MTQYATDFRAPVSAARRARSGALARAAGDRRGLVWAFVQPWRLTLLHPYGEGFWWLVVEPPLLVSSPGILFHAFVARPLVHDLEEPT